MPTATDLTAVTALMRAQAAVRDDLTAQASSLATDAVTSFVGWYSTEQITAWATALAKRVDPLQRVLALSTDAYLARLMSLLIGRRIRPIGRVDIATLRPGTTHAGAYGRIADAYRWQQAKLDAAARALPTERNPAPPTLQSAMDAAVERAKSVAEMDLQLVVRGQSQQVMTEGQRAGLITGYRRVIHPELSRGGTCGLCVAASHRIYHVAELMPIHHRCNCVPTPIVDGNDVGSAVNAADLRRLYREAGSTGAADLKRTRYQITDAGDLGPLLEPEGTARQGERQSDHAPKTDVQLRANLARARNSLGPALATVRELAQNDPSKWSEYLRTLEARVAALDRQLAA